MRELAIACAALAVVAAAGCAGGSGGKTTISTTSTARVRTTIVVVSREVGAQRVTVKVLLTIWPLYRCFDRGP